MLPITFNSICSPLEVVIRRNDPSNGVMGSDDVEATAVDTVFTQGQTTITNSFDELTGGNNERGCSWGARAQQRRGPRESSILCGAKQVPKVPQLAGVKDTTATGVGDVDVDDAT